MVRGQDPCAERSGPSGRQSRLQGVQVRNDKHSRLVLPLDCELRTYQSCKASATRGLPAGLQHTSVGDGAPEDLDLAPTGQAIEAVRKEQESLISYRHLASDGAPFYQVVGRRLELNYLARQQVG